MSKGDQAATQKKTSSVRFTVTAAGLAGMLAALPGVISSMRGEPLAETVHSQTTQVVQKITQQQQKTYIKLAERVIRLEERQAASAQLVKDLMKLVNSRTTRRARLSVSTPPQPTSACSSGELRIRGKCLSKTDFLRKARKEVVREAPAPVQMPALKK